MQALIIQLGLGTVPPGDFTVGNSDWPVYATNEPDYPDNCLTVLDGPDQFDARIMATGEEQIHQGFSVRIRSTDHQTGWQKAKAVYHSFCLNVGGANGVILVATTADGNIYPVVCLTNLKGPNPKGKDATRTKRSIFTVDGFLVT
jgi:hypothetical protein